MTCDQVIHLTEKICDFLVSCGGPYKEVTEQMQKEVINALVTGQYILSMDGAGIAYFASFWRIWPEDIETVRRLNQPADICTGPLVYVVEAGKRDGSMVEVARALKNINFDATHALWHRRGILKKYPLKGGKI